MSAETVQVQVSDTQVPELSRGCRLGKGQGPGEQVLLMPEGLIKLSDSAVRILQLCDGKRSVAEIVAELQKEYAVSAHEKIRSDVQVYLTTLVSKKALELR